MRGCGSIDICVSLQLGVLNYLNRSNAVLLQIESMSLSSAEEIKRCLGALTPTISHDCQVKSELTVPTCLVQNIVTKTKQSKSINKKVQNSILHFVLSLVHLQICLQ